MSLAVTKLIIHGYKQVHGMHELFTTVWQVVVGGFQGLARMVQGDV